MWGEPALAVNRLIPRRRIIRALLFVVIALTVASVSVQVLDHVFDRNQALGLVPLFDANREENIPTWYASITLFVCALILAGLAMHASRRGESPRRFWLVIALLALASIDETAQLHEWGGRLLRDAVNAENEIANAWIVPGTIIAVLLFVPLRAFFTRCPAPVRRGAAVAGAVYVGGALGIEILEEVVFGPSGDFGLDQAILGTAQEFAEMVGVLIFLDVLLTWGDMYAPSFEMAMDARPDGNGKQRSRPPAANPSAAR
jgi:hypothetical protein